jgi:uncharacterized membrane protein (UPF0127 family)
MTVDGKRQVSLKVEIADSAKERTKGLMNRTRLEKDTGMLFVFPAPQMMSFWMKNTLIPLEILYFDVDGNFINALVMQPCEADPCAQYPSAAQASYALEVAPGYRADHAIGSGWKLDVKQVKAMSNPK